ncbi:MAG: hypothetical protein IT578_01280 [Verrucomicrobiae bacterium]|nr:hypothetical protein [Verrucomicrobiae bacterium]
MTTNYLAPFRADVTPPLGHPLCAGWYDHALAISDPLHALGVVLLGDGAPIVLCALDWAEMSNLSHIAWRERLAAAAGTTAERVAVQCGHPHCTPWPDEEADRLVSAFPEIPRVMDPAWCAAALDRVAAALGEAVRRPHRLTHLGLGRAKVEKVASNRRVMGSDGRVRAVRWTQTKDPAVRAEPEGLIDPWLKTISFWDGGAKIAALHYYAVHPTSYDTDHTVTPDFMGLARERRAAEEPGVLHAFFTECAGNITAGKYNDGAKENRPVFTERIYRALVESEREVARVPVEPAEWRVANVVLPPRDDETMETLLARLNDAACPPKRRSQAALQVAYRRRLDRPIPITALSFGKAAHVLHLPGESFIEYQVFAQHLRPKAWVAVASYGDCGPGYICMENSAAEGGYEPIDSFVSGKCEAIMKGAIRRVLAA